MELERGKIYGRGAKSPIVKRIEDTKNRWQSKVAVEINPLDKEPPFPLSEEERKVFDDIVNLNDEFSNLANIDKVLVAQYAQEYVMLAPLRVQLRDALLSEDIKLISPYNTAMNGLTSRMEKLGKQIGVGALNRRGIPAFQDRLVDKLKEMNADSSDDDILDNELD